ncbi:TetR/AcrR family transcriptional regulator [Archangium primigenium]|uniref:TetR/AcrR family transcriptional regulator n=1 Tax=[Archangium] primigenium TaxID=2792470 RepID=UPI001959D5F7|nr:TetR/AcrR family transcriptional regulator [Archangium primigenium]MBM7117952.1 TetR/AcrR family transcriptional regulator [Archangium primigenium]
MNRDSAKSAAAPRLRARLKEATGEAIRVAAEEVLGEQGFGARMEDIAARAGVSVGTLYNHFKDREALLLELLRVRREQLLERVDTLVGEVDGRAVGEQLRALLGLVLDHFREHSRFFALVLQSELHRGPALPRQRTTLTELSTRVEVVLQRGVAAGQVRREGAEFHATLLVGMLRGLLLRVAETQRGDELQRGADELLRLFLKGIEV